MASVQDRLKLKRVPYETWSTREQLCLAASVLNSGETNQNWRMVSESLKPFAEKEALRPPDWFSQKSCATQYSYLLESADTPKRKKREIGESNAESIVSRLTQERIAELKQILAFQRDEYQQLKAEVNLLKCGPLSDEKLQKMWQVIEHEEREQEQKARAHTAWLAKRQQKQGSTVSQSVSLHRKPGEQAAENYEPSGMDTSTNEEEEKKRGGRSPLLTSLLKSTSPTTQIQTPTPTQAGSPTIASLLVSSPKVPSAQLDHARTGNVSSQLQQLVSSTIASVVSERPSVGAPTLSMLLELPANSQRGPLPNLQESGAAVTQASIPPEIHTPLPTVTSTVSQNMVEMARIPAVSVSQNIPVTESMVQIIDHIDDVIGKDIMADVIDKDEINEIIGDIEELIKEEITASPRTNETRAPPAPIEDTTSTEPAHETPSARPEPRNVDELVSTSDSPDSEMAIEDIDSSTSNIAEIIGTVAVEPTEPKIMSPSQSPKLDEVVKAEPTDINDDNTDNESLPEENKNSIDDKDEPVEEAESSPKFESKESESNESTQIETHDSEKKIERQDTPELSDNTEKAESELVVVEKEATCDNACETKSNTEESEDKEEDEMDQLEIHLAEITGDPQNKLDGVAAARQSTETPNDVVCTEDTEKSQDISLILEDDEGSQSVQNEEKAAPREVVSDIQDTSESCPEESITSTEEEADAAVKVDTVAEQSVAKSKDDIPEEVQQEKKKEDEKDSVDLIVHKGDCKDEKANQASATEPNISTGLAATEIVKEEQGNADTPVKEEEIETMIEQTAKDQEQNGAKIEIKKEPVILNTETKVEDSELHEDKSEQKETPDPELAGKTETLADIGDDGDLDEEESSLSKLSGGRTMKTYSKRPAVTIDSEPETEGGGEGADYRAWKKAVMLVFNRLVTHKYASVFLRPITEDQAPGYHSVIFRPMDLSTIKKNIDNGTIRSTMHFQRDVMLMFQNAIMYNKQDTFVYKMAVSMQEECLQHMQILVQVTGEGPFRRETRTAANSSSDFGESSSKQQRKRSHITPSPHDSDSPRIKKRRKSEND